MDPLGALVGLAASKVAARLSVDTSSRARVRPRVLGGLSGPLDSSLDTRFGHPPSEGSNGLLGWAWRNRRELAPGGVGLGLVVGSVGGHLVYPGLAWAPLVGGAVVTCACVVQAARPKRVYAGGMGSAATLWVTASWALGLGSWAMLVALMIGWGASWVLWYRHVHPRSRVHVEGGSWRPWKWEAWCFRRDVLRRLNRIIREWPATARDAGVPGSRIRLAEGDRLSYRLHIDLRPGQTVEDLNAARGRLESALSSRRGRVRIATDGFADRAVLTWALGDPLSGVAKWEGPAASSFTEPITIATYQDGQPLAIRFSEGIHWLVTGQTGMGKSSLMDLLVGSFAACSDVVIWACDPENGVSLGKWAAVLGWLSDEDDALKMLDAVMVVHRIRLDIMRAAGVSDWSSDLGPYLAVILDEFPALSTAAKARAAEIAKRCRKTGTRLFVLAQVSSAEEIGSTALRGSLRGTICFALKESRHADFAFPAGGREAGWDPLRLEQKGDVLVQSPDHREPVPARTFLADAETAQSWASKLAAMERPRIDLGSRVTSADPVELAVVDSDDEGEATDEGGLDEPARQEAVLQIMRSAGEPLAGRAIARMAGLKKSSVLGNDLPALVAAGLVVRLDLGLWALAEIDEDDVLEEAEAR